MMKSGGNGQPLIEWTDEEIVAAWKAGELVLREADTHSRLLLMAALDKCGEMSDGAI